MLTKQEYINFKKKIEAEYKAKLDHLNALAPEMEKEIQKEEKVKEDVRLNRKKFKLTPLMKKAIATNEGEFDTEKVKKWIQKFEPEFDMPNIVISGRLIREAKRVDSTIEVVSKGSGSTPTIYRKKELKVEKTS